MGGYNEDIVERYDPREDRWALLPTMPSNFSASFTRSFANNHNIYGFTLSAGYIFDIRGNKWMETGISSPPYNW